MLTGQEAEAVAGLPDLSTPSRQRAVATGTDSGLVNDREDKTVETKIDTCSLLEMTTWQRMSTHLLPTPRRQRGISAYKAAI